MENIIITIDPKQNRIRFYRTFLKELGNPKYVQLMVNSKDKILAIKPSETLDSFSVKLNSHIEKEHCYELHSLNLITELFNLMNWTEKNYTYKIVGRMDKATTTGFFPLTQATKIEFEEL